MAVLHHMLPSPPSVFAKVQHAKEAEASVIPCTAVYFSDSVYELCQSNVKLWINIYCCDDVANPSLSMSQN